MKTNILFVCLGNICRSPAADGIMHHIVEERGLSGRIGIDSAGTYAGHTGELPDARMRRAAARRGYDLGHRARQIREEDFDRFAEKIFRMREFFRRHPRWDHVPDPYYEGAEGFELVLDMLEDGCGGILEYLENPQ
ncbi:MAG: phosphotyrosine protein phosphatase [Alistipes sp. 58_9_plus]|nr:MAG: phosphotyrosine protein phosphatase [Alistipes sp. 58_9_plus]